MANNSSSSAVATVADGDLAEAHAPASDSPMAGNGEHRTRETQERVVATHRAIWIRALTSLGETNVAIAALTVTYLIAVANSMGRRLWFDELFTWYIAQAPTLSRLMDALTHVDLNPPLIYLLVRVFHAVFGSSEFATRLPVALGFYSGSIGVFVFLKRRIGVMWSAVAILAFWSTPYLRFATQARPYGLLLGFFALTLVSYDRAKTSERSSWIVCGIAAGNIGMMLSHVFAPLSIFPFCAAEAARSILRRRIDWPVCAALVLPVSIGAMYIPATRNFQQIYFPQVDQASWGQSVDFFARLSSLYALAMIAACILAFAVLPYSAARRQKFPTGWPGIVWAVSLLLVPVILNVVLMRTQGAFAERYCLTTAFGFYIFATVALAWGTGFRRSSAGVAAIVLCVSTLAIPRVHDPVGADSEALRTIRRDLPLVAASGAPFLEMDRYENDDFTSRLYYLVDRDAAIRYAHATMFENFPLLTHYFPIRAHVLSYDAFIAEHPHFLVLTRADYIEAWLLAKLRHDGARIVLTGSLSSSYKPAQLYEVQR